MSAADATPLCPVPIELAGPEPSVREVSPSLAADDPCLRGRAPSALARGQRDRPRKKRPSVRHELRMAGHVVFISVGHRPDGTVQEFFVDLEHKEGAPLRGAGHIVAASNSLALQHGAPLRSVCSALRAARFEPAGDVEGHDTITSAASLFDLVAQVLEAEDAVLREKLARERAEEAKGQ